MNKWILISGFLLAAFGPVLSQRTQDLKLPAPTARLSNSLYNTLRVRDARVDTSSLGTLNVGQRGKEMRVVPVTPLSIQLAAVMDSLVDTTARKGTLLLQLRRLKISTMTVARRDLGYCLFRASLYVQRRTTFQSLAFMDTIIVATGDDLAEQLGKNLSAAIAEFIANNLQRDGAGQGFTELELSKADSIEKRRMPLYTATEYKNGIYNTYAAFAKQVPDHPVQAEFKNGELVNVLSMEKKDGVEVDRNRIYAVVVDGKPFIATEFDYYALQKVNDSFYYAGNLKISADARQLVLAGPTATLIDNVIPSYRIRSEMFEVKIDHLTGDPIPMMSTK